MAEPYGNNFRLPENDVSQEIIKNYYIAYFGRTPSAPEYKMWYGKGTRELERALIKNTQNIYGAGKGARVTNVNPNTGEVETQFSVKPIVDKPLSSPSGSEVVFPGGGGGGTTTTPKVLTFDEWVALPNNRELYGLSKEEIEAKNAEYFQRQKDYLTQQKTWATEDYQLQDTVLRENLGASAADRGVFGSGIYNKELNRQTTQLGEQFNRQWSESDVNSTYSQRKYQIENEEERQALEDFLNQKQVGGIMYGLYQDQLSN